jgi:uncharacterized protein (TIGR02001 family)
MKAALLALMLLGPATAVADSAWEWSYNMSFVTDYLFRGISQNGDNPSVQGGIDLAHSSGWYVGAWAAIVDQVELRGTTTDDTRTELDLYGGYGGNFTDAFSYDVGLIYYAYPVDAEQLNFAELYGSLTYDFGPAALTGGLAYSPDFFGETDDAVYYYAELGIPLPSNFSASLHYGHQDIDDNTVFGTPDYDEWSAGLAYAVNDNVEFALTYADTDLSENECFGGTDLCDATTTFAINLNW